MDKMETQLRYPIKRRIARLKGRRAARSELLADFEICKCGQNLLHSRFLIPAPVEAGAAFLPEGSPRTRSAARGEDIS